MTIDQIILNVQAANGASPAPAKKKKPAGVEAKGKTNGHTVLKPDESLAISAARIVAAFNLTEKGVTVASLVAGVKAYEAPYTGVVQ